MPPLRMRILIALLLVPTLALAGPRKRRKKLPPKPKPAPAEPAPAADNGKDQDKDLKPDTDGDKTDDANQTTGSGGTDASPPPTTTPQPTSTTKPSSDDVDVDTLRQEYLSLRDELFKSRARANAVASQLYSTRVQIKLTYTTARYYNPAKASIRLDGATVYENATGAIGGDDGVRFDGYVAPGRHLVTFRVEATGKDDPTFTSVTESQIVVKAVAGKDLVVAARAKDSGDIAYNWKKKESGSYGLGIDVSVKSEARPAKGKK